MSIKQKIEAANSIVIDQQTYLIDERSQYSERVEILSVHNKRDKKFVVIHPKITDKKELKKFFERRRVADAVRQYIQQDYTGPVFLPPASIDETQSYILMPYGGAALTKEKVESLSINDQKRLQRGLATFLNATHQRSLADPTHLPNVPGKEKVGQCESSSGRENDAYYDCLFDAWKGLADPKLIAELKKKINAFKKRDRSDEICVLTHNDFDPCNVLYDDKTKRPAVIDYEFCMVTSVYEDFCHFGGLVWPKKFMHGMIQYYNTLTRQSPHPTPVSWKKLEQMWEIAALYNQACWIKEWTGERTPSQTFADFMETRERLAEPLSKPTRDVIR